MVHKSLRDLKHVFFCAPFRHWPFGSVYCVINNFVAYLTVSASVLTLMAITIDR